MWPFSYLVVFIWFVAYGIVLPIIIVTAMRMLEKAGRLAHPRGHVLDQGVPGMGSVARLVAVFFCVLSGLIALAAGALSLPDDAPPPHPISSYTD